MLTDYWAYEYLTNPKAHQDEVEDEDFDLEAELSRIEREAAGNLDGEPDDPDDWETIK